MVCSTVNGNCQCTRNTPGSFRCLKPIQKHLGRRKYLKWLKGDRRVKVPQELLRG